MKVWQRLEVGGPAARPHVFGSLAAVGGSLERGVDDGHDALRFSGAERVGALTWLGCFSTCGTRFPLGLHIFEVLSRKYESEKQNHSIVKDFRCGHDMSGWQIGLLLVQDAFDTMQKDFLEREGQKRLGFLGGNGLVACPSC